jgi:ABC-type sulfate transport system substrate-binding protein
MVRLVKATFVAAALVSSAGAALAQSGGDRMPGTARSRRLPVASGCARNAGLVAWAPTP